jgi:hypothetical protein
VKPEPARAQGHSLPAHPVRWADKTAKRRCDLQAPGTQVQVPPARLDRAGVIAVRGQVLAVRTRQPLAAQHDSDHHPARLESDVAHPDARQAQQARECGRGAHGDRPSFDRLQRDTEPTAPCASPPTITWRRQSLTAGCPISLPGCPPSSRRVAVKAGPQSRPAGTGAQRRALTPTLSRLLPAHPGNDQPQTTGLTRSARHHRHPHPCRKTQFFEGTEQIQQLVIARAISGLRIE